MLYCGSSLKCSPFQGRTQALAPSCLLLTIQMPGILGNTHMCGLLLLVDCYVIRYYVIICDVMVCCMIVYCIK